MLSRKSKLRHALSRGATIGIVIVIIIIIAAGGLYAVSVHPSTTTSTPVTTPITSSIVTTPTTSVVSSTSSSSAVSSTSTSSSSSSSTTLTTLVIDDVTWPHNDVNQLYAVDTTPWPDWGMYDVYQPLIAVNLTAEYDVGTIQFLPSLASNWTVSASGETYTLNLRQNVTFSNGDPFNAYQVWMELYGFYYLSGNASNWWVSYPLFNMSSVIFGPSTIALINQSGLVNPSQQAQSIMMNSSWPIYVASPYQIVFQLQSPFVYFPGTLVSWIGLMFDTQYVLDHGGFGTPTSINSYFNLNPIPGTGPYMFTGISENSYVKFTQNPTYWGRTLTQAQISADVALDPGHVKNVIVYAKSDDISRYTDLSTGAAQISAILTDDWNLVQGNPSKYSYLGLPPWSGELTAIALNAELYPTNITDFRQAIVHAINYSDIDQSVFFGKISPMVGPEAPVWSQYYDLGGFPPYSYNLTVAEQYLKESGVNVTTLAPLSYTVVSGCDFCTDIAEIVQGNLAQLGITVNIEVESVNDYYSPYSSYTAEASSPSLIPNLSLGWGETWGPDAITPADNWIYMVSNGSLYGNWAIYASPTVQAAINAFISSTNTTYIKSLVAAAQAQIYNDAPYAWLGTMGLWYAGGSLVWQKGVVSGFYADPTWDGEDTAPFFNTVTFG